MSDSKQNIFPLSDSGTADNEDRANSVFDEIMSEVGLTDVKRTAPIEDKEIVSQPDKEESVETEDQADREDVQPEISISKRTYEKLDAAADVAKKGFRTVGKKIKNSDTFRPEVLKDMFFGDKTNQEESSEDGYDDIESEQLLFGKKKRRRSDPRGDKMLFRIMYMITPEQVAESYMLFYNEFIKKKNIKITLVLITLSLVFLIAILLAPQGYVSYMLLLITLLLTAMRWINSWNDKREALACAGDVKNDSYMLSFYNSRILIEASEKDGETVRNYPPVIIRFEDIDLKLLDYEDIYILVFRKDYLYVLPKESMTEQENQVFCSHLKNILGEDFYVFEKRPEKVEDQEEFPTLKDESSKEEDIKENDNDGGNGEEE